MGMGRYGMGMGYPMGMYGMGMYPGMFPGMGYGMWKDEQGDEYSSVMPDKTIEDQIPMESRERSRDNISHDNLTALSEPIKE